MGGTGFGRTERFTPLFGRVHEDWEGVLHVGGGSEGVRIRIVEGDDPSSCDTLATHNFALKMLKTYRHENCCLQQFFFNLSNKELL